MRQLAADFSADAELWETVGLCHDLDFFETRNDPSQHGLLTARWLGDSIPHEARRAIEAHDHRTGVVETTLLADMLKLADVVAIIRAAVGGHALSQLAPGEPLARLRASLSERPYLCAILEQHSEKRGVTFARIGRIVSGMPA